MGKETIIHYRARRHFGLARQTDELVRRQVTGFVVGQADWIEGESHSQTVEEHELYYQTIKDGLVDIDKKIRRRQKRKQEELPGFYDIKNTLVFLALQLRRDGEGRIKVKMRSDFSWSNPTLHDQCKISFFDQNTREEFSTFTKLSFLDTRGVNDLPSLIGKPDGILAS
ncbi:hypothetical protein HYV64_04685 [Candidatus Shapirobacteria bacterium]|nr:hypothetical protein [Candidatus Shapirobacteria bacterium]